MPQKKATQKTGMSRRNYLDTILADSLGLMEKSQIRLVYTHCDRFIYGGIIVLVLLYLSAEN